MITVYRELHPYILPLPTNISGRVEYITTLFSTPVIIEVLRLFKWGSEICQKEIITTLKHHSNKTVLNSIRRLLMLGLLEEVDRVEVRGNRRVRVKCYKLTDTGKWYNILFKDVNELDSETIREAVTNLSVMFMAKILPFSEHLKVNFLDFLSHIVSSAVGSVSKVRKYREYDLVVFGSLALDIYLKPEVRVCPGGSGANVAVIASNLGLKTCFVGRVPTNIIGSYMLAELISEDVDVSLTELGQEVTLPVCVVLEPLEPVEMRCGMRLDLKSLPVILQVSDDIIQVCSSSRSLYLGEGVCKTYLELLSRVGRDGKVVVFRPHKTVLEEYLEEFISILQYSPILLLNEEKERILRSRGFKVPEDLFRVGVKEVIVTRGSRGAVLYIRGREPIIYDAPSVNTVNTVGAGDVFSASLIYYLLGGASIEVAVKKAVHLSTLSTTQPSSRKYLANQLRTLGD
jgi:sugar/nucleoside kinase (ribokinase family)